MNPELGTFTLCLAAVLAGVQFALPLWAAWRGHALGMAVARPLAWGQAALLSLAFAVLVSALVGHDFSVRYVVANSHRQLPWVYRVCAAWGGHEGSVLLWGLMLALWGAAVAQFGRRLPPEVLARVLAVMGFLQAGLLAFVLAASNPFARTLPAAADGQGLNPLLQDVGMIAHPPLLYMGYVGFSVAFAFAIAALLGGRLDAAWARWTRPWTLAAWAFLTAGIGLGSAWAYHELGWGGWWFWDAVENASLMPWLVGAALIHSLAVTEKRNSFKNWTLLLALLAFSLSLLGTFLVRSGVLSSVHAFAADPRRGVLILVFLGVVMGAALLLYAWRAPRVGLGEGFALCSREALLLVNNLLLTTAAASVLLGTLYPLVLDALGLGKLSVGTPYFDAVFTPLMLPLVVLTAVGPLLAWRQARLAQAVQPLRWAALAALAVAALGVLAWHSSALVALGLAAGVWLLLGTGAEGLKWWRATRRSAGATWPPLAWWGMVLAHAGLGVFVLGVTLARGLESGGDVSLRPGASVALHGALAGETLHFVSLEKVPGPNYVAARARFEYRREGETVATLWPEKRLYTAQRMPMTEAAVQHGVWADRYLALSEATPDGAWVVRVQHKPGMSWLWAGVAWMTLGGGLAALDRRYRQRQPAPVGEGAAALVSGGSASVPGAAPAA